MSIQTLYSDGVNCKLLLVRTIKFLLYISNQFFKHAFVLEKFVGEKDI